MTIFSMTGFGEASGKFESQTGSEVRLRVQIKSVNQRFCEVYFKLPSLYARLETEAQKVVKSSVKRGKIEVSLHRDETTDLSATRINVDALKDLLAQIKLIEIEGVSGDKLKESFLNSVWQRKEVFSSTITENSDLPVEEETKLFQDLLREAINSFVASREKEGEMLKAELETQIDLLRDYSIQISKWAEGVKDIYRERLTKRIIEFGLDANFNQDRLLQEVCFLVDKADIREEIVRLDSHLLAFSDVLRAGSNESSGKRLEFLTQEIGREINTMGSKSSISELSAIVIEAKVVLERIREQIQNVE